MHISVDLYSLSGKTITFYKVAEKFKGIIRSGYAKSIVNPDTKNSEAIKSSILHMTNILTSIDQFEDQTMSLVDDLIKLNVSADNQDRYRDFLAVLADQKLNLLYFLSHLKNEALANNVPIDQQLLSLIPNTDTTGKSFNSVKETVLDIVVIYKFQELLKKEADVSIPSDTLLSFIMIRCIIMLFCRMDLRQYTLLLNVAF